MTQGLAPWRFIPGVSTPCSPAACIPGVQGVFHSSTAAPPGVAAVPTGGHLPLHSPACPALACVHTSDHSMCRDTQGCPAALQTVCTCV